MTRRRMGWVTHAIVDAALGIGLLIAGIHGNGADYLVLDAAGGCLLFLTLFTDGPGGIRKLIPRLAHRVVDGILALALFASPIIVWKNGVHLDTFATAMAVAVGVILLRDAIVSDHRIVPRLPRRNDAAAATRARAIDTRAFEAGVHDAARRAGAVTGKVATKTAAARERRRALKN